MLKDMFSNPYYWAALGFTLLFAETVGVNLSPAIGGPLTFIVGAIGGFLSAMLSKHERN